VIINLLKNFGVLVLLVAILGLGVGVSYAYGYDQGHQKGLVVGQTTAQRAIATTGGQTQPAGAAATAPAAATPATGATPAAGQRQGAGGAQGQMRLLGGGTIGTVEKIEGKTITLTPILGSGAGSVVRVVTNENTTVQRLAAGSLADIKVGDRITVQGQQGSDGAITATTIQVVPAGQ